MMDAKAQSSPPNNADVKAAFHKPSNDASNRNYRRHSLASNSSSSDGPFLFPSFYRWLMVL